MKAKPDLLTRTQEVMREHRCTHAEARAILGRRGAASRQLKRDATARERARMERMGLS